ncbi:hypothetical protein Q7P37_008280 [Cladosporium fusiforme]
MATISTTFTHITAIDATSPLNTSNLRGKSILITGAASGIGESCLRSFVSAGASVTFGDLPSSSTRAEALVSELGADKVTFIPCDTRLWKDQAALFKKASDLHDGNIDIVFANAGISGSDPVFNDTADPSTDEPVEPDLNILHTNLVGFMYTTKLALHYFARQKSSGTERDRCLIMTSSMAGYADHNGAPQYSAAKFGVRGMMRSLRQMMPKQEARVNIIAPWFIRTGIISGAALEKLQAGHVPFANVEDAAAAVLHLASDKTLNGRAVAILPREITPHGYVDLEQDDDKEGDSMSVLKEKIAGVSVRVGTK